MDAESEADVAAERLPAAGDVEAVRVLEQARVAVGCPIAEPDFGVSRDPHAGDLSVVSCGAEHALHRAFQPDDLLDRVRDQ